MADKPYGYTIFCDDIRQEIGGKFSLMGIYHGVILLHGQFPFTLPKLVMAVTYIEPASLRTPKIKLVVYMPGEEKPSVEVEGDLEKMRASTPDYTDPKMPGEAVISFRPNIISEPIVFKEPGSLRVRAYIGDEEIKLGALRVLQGTTREPPKAASID